MIVFPFFFPHCYYPYRNENMESLKKYSHKNWVPDDFILSWLPAVGSFVCYRMNDPSELWTNVVNHVRRVGVWCCCWLALIISIIWFACPCFIEWLGGAVMNVQPVQFSQILCAGAQISILPFLFHQAFQQGRAEGSYWRFLSVEKTCPFLFLTISGLKFEYHNFKLQSYS